MSPIEEPEAFRASPYVCGYLGQGSPELWQRLQAGAPAELVASSAGRLHAVAASTAPLLERASGSWCWGRYVVDTGKPSSWRDASFALGLAGIWFTDTEALLHSDLFGTHDLFHRTIDGTVYFANRISPLRDLGGELTTNWAGWGASLAFGGFIGTGTPFVEIARLEGGSALKVDDGGVHLVLDTPDWLTGEEPAGDVDSVARAVRGAVPGLLSRSERQLTLSGGWDSRLIALAMAKNRTRRPTAWTADPDNGFVDDIEMSKAVARALGLKQEIVPTEDQAWLHDRPVILARVEHLNWLHTWLGPVARRLRGAASQVVDGLGGDVLLRNLFVGEDLIASPTDEARLQLQFQALGAARLSAGTSLDPALQASWTESTFRSMKEIGDKWAGHPSEYVLRAISVRTSRLIAPSPLRLFAPEVPVLLPLMAPDVVRAALAVPVSEKSDRRFYRALLGGLDPRVGALPSTNDGIPKTPTERPRSQTRPEALTAMADAISADGTVLGLLKPETADRLAQKPLGRVQSDIPLGVLQWASALADWRSSNARVLRPADVPSNV